MKTTAFLKYLVHSSLWKQSFAPNSLQAPSNFIFFDKFDNYEAFNTASSYN